MNRRRALAGWLLVALLEVNALYLHINIQFATCPVPTAKPRDAHRLVVMAVGLGRVGTVNCGTGGAS